MRFFLGTHETRWLERTTLPLFVSHRQLSRRVRLPRARGPWSLDSGGFTELRMFGRWETTASAYVDAVRRYHAEVGKLAWAAPQDWMCEPAMLASTGLGVEEHQWRTIENVLALRSMAPELPFICVLQGWTLSDYMRHVELYARAGIELGAEPIVGIGSVCRRQATSEIERIVMSLHELGLRLHGFGVKIRGLARYADGLSSSDSMAWSYSARKSAPLDGCTHQHCANCLRFATRWYGRVVSSLEEQQTRLAL